MSARRRTLEDARRTAQDDDIRPLVLQEAARYSSASGEKIEAAYFEDLFQQQMQKYSFYRDTLSGNERKQNQILAKIRKTNEDFLAVRRSDPVLRDREEALQKLDLAIAKHQEIAVNISEALHFYKDFATLLDQLRGTVREVRSLSLPADNAPLIISCSGYTLDERRLRLTSTL